MGNTSLDLVHCEPLARLGVAPVLVGLLLCFLPSGAFLPVKAAPQVQAGLMEWTWVPLLLALVACSVELLHDPVPTFGSKGLATHHAAGELEGNNLVRLYIG